MATHEETLTFLASVDALLGLLAGRLGRIVLSGELNGVQQGHLRSALDLVDGFRAIFRAERERLTAAALPTLAAKES